jgi:predicted nucleic acid-binding protein
MRAAPAPHVLAWADGQSAAAMCTTSVTVAEIRYGIERMPAGRRRTLLRTTADDVFAAFADQVLPFDAKAAGEYAQVVVGRDRAGVPISGFDAQIAAICRTRGAALATRNTQDFTGTGVELVDPWTAAGRL